MRSGHSVENSQSSFTAVSSNSRLMHDAYSRTTWREQQLKLMDTVAAIVGTLDERELFQSIISHTGRKHADFGVQTSHFTAFGDTDMGLAKATCSRIYARDGAGMDCAL